MVNIETLVKLLSSLAKDVSEAYKTMGIDSFNVYYQLIQNKDSFERNTMSVARYPHGLSLKTQQYTMIPKLA